MRILGIHDGHNAAACLMEDGRILSALQEERFTRVKNHDGFPCRAIDELLALHGLRPDDIDIIALSSGHMPYPRTKEDLLGRFRQSGSVGSKLKFAARATPVNSLFRRKRRRVRTEAVRQAGLPADRIAFVEHHLAHAATAYWGSPFRDQPVLLLTNDGAGDDLCATVSLGENGCITRIASVHESHSLGLIYATVTFLLGMVPNEHEYKLMGMAPYAPSAGAAHVADLFSSMLEIDPDNPLVFRRKDGVPSAYLCLKHVEEMLRYLRFDWICAGLQKFTEDLLTRWVANCVRYTGIRSVALSGGVFMNVKANKCISELPEVDRLFVFPSCGDETNAIGACYYIYADHCRRNGAVPDMPPIGPIYWGRDYSEDELRDAIEGFGAVPFSHKQYDDVETRIAELLAAGEVVARFTGPMEFGARALGNRSILADPSNTAVIRVINEMIKCRDFWMPFAITILEEDADRYVENPKGIAAPYMILTFDTTEKVRDIIAGVHPYDFTVRPQVLARDTNPSYHRLISRFKELRGIPAVLNTSFNLHGYPIVASPEDALEVFATSGLKYLALGNHILKKSTRPITLETVRRGPESLGKPVQPQKTSEETGQPETMQSVAESREVAH